MRLSRATSAAVEDDASSTAKVMVFLSIVSYLSQLQCFCWTAMRLRAGRPSSVQYARWQLPHMGKLPLFVNPYAQDFGEFKDRFS